MACNSAVYTSCEKHRASRLTAWLPDCLGDSLGLANILQQLTNFACIRCAADCIAAGGVGARAAGPSMQAFWTKLRELRAQAGGLDVAGDNRFNLQVWFRGVYWKGQPPSGTFHYIFIW